MPMILLNDTVSCIESLHSAGISIHFKVKIILFLLNLLVMVVPWLAWCVTLTLLSHVYNNMIYLVLHVYHLLQVWWS